MVEACGYIVWRMWWLEKENGIYGASGLYIYIYIHEVLGGLYVWVEVWKDLRFFFFHTFWKDLRFFIL